MTKTHRIEVSQQQLDDLKDRLARTRWPAELPDTGWSRGVPATYLRELAEQWRERYDWRKHEAALNALPQFTTALDGATVHFFHVRSKNPNALPLILTHGWPGSALEYTHLAGPLRDDFHLVIPSIPGFGFSGPLREAGWNLTRIAKAWAALMRELGYRRYGAAGNDFGAMISRELGLVDPEHVAAVHLTTVMSFPMGEVKDLSDEDKRRLGKLEHYRNDMLGYGAIQSTRPQTLAYALHDSPVGQLAWIAEKFVEWTGSQDAVDRDTLLTNVTLYWLTGTAGSSANLYYENAHAGGWGPPPKSATPTGVAVFPGDFALPIRRFAERDNTNLVRWTEMPRGGHFGSLEEPALYAADVRELFERYR
jgi:epoxide hydrolase